MSAEAEKEQIIFAAALREHYATNWCSRRPPLQFRGERELDLLKIHLVAVNVAGYISEIADCQERERAAKRRKVMEMDSIMILEIDQINE